jgi:hypothetical protein
MSDAKQVKGEGNYEAAEKFNKAEQAFVKSGRVDQSARDAEPKSQAEAEELKRAEEKAEAAQKKRIPAVARPGSTNQVNKKDK